MLKIKKLIGKMNFIKQNTLIERGKNEVVFGVNEINSWRRQF